LIPGDDEFGMVSLGIGGEVMDGFRIKVDPSAPSLSRVKGNEIRGFFASLSLFHPFSFSRLLDALFRVPIKGNTRFLFGVGGTEESPENTPGIGKAGAPVLDDGRPGIPG